jgi:hypothetical protein
MIRYSSNVIAIWNNVIKHNQNVTPLLAVCVNNIDYPASLELHKVYQVISAEDAAADGDLRIMDESGEDYLYPADYFLLMELPEETEEALLHTF